MIRLALVAMIVSVSPALGPDGDSGTTAGQNDFVTRSVDIQKDTKNDTQDSLDTADPAAAAKKCESTDPAACEPLVTCDADTDSETGGRIHVRRLFHSWRLGTCTPTAGPGERAVITSTIVLHAFRRIPLPKSEVIIQPPGHKTLVNFDTLFRTEAEPFRRNVRLLGSTIELDITPASFLWRHGDGTTQTSTSPGIGYASSIPMERYISHQYEHTGDAVPVSVDTTYSARYRVNGGAWLDVDGTVTATGTRVNLRVVEARSVLLGR